MKRNNKKMRIGQIANDLKVEQSVIRFWEKEFNIKSERTRGGQRIYKKNDIEAFKKVKYLLYDKGFTINGAKQHLKQLNNNANIENNIDIKFKAASAEHISKNKYEKLDNLNNQINFLYKRLIKLKELL